MASKRIRDRNARVRRCFLRRPQPEDRKPPLGRLLQGGRGGEAKLKVYLTLLWLGGGADRHTVSHPARSYARLLDFDDPEAKGARRVRDSIESLEYERLVSVERRQGRDPRITLLREDGSGDAYRIPGASGQNNKDPNNSYLKIPPGFWTQGWAAALTGPGLAMLLVLLEEARSRPRDDMWMTPSQVADRYGFSGDTRMRGVQELQRVGLVCISQTVRGPDFERTRRRNAYHLDPALLGERIDLEAEQRWRELAARFGMTDSEAWKRYVCSRVASGQFES